MNRDFSNVSLQPARSVTPSLKRTMPIITSPKNRDHDRGGDQARKLRSLVAIPSTWKSHELTVSRRCHTIAIAGGKGGVGRSVIALNLAILLAQRGASVGLLDACPDFGSLELLCGLNGYWNLSHVANGCRSLSDVVQAGPGGIRLISGASCLTEMRSHSSNGSHRTPGDVVTSGTEKPLHTANSSTHPKHIADLVEFERELDWLIIDASGGGSYALRDLAWEADDVLVVTTPEATAVAEAYSSVKSFAKSGGPRMGLLVNQADSASQAQQILDRLQQAAHSFLRIDLHRRGFVPRDVVVPNSVNARNPFVLQAPQSSATTALTQLVQRWMRPWKTTDQTSYFTRLCFGADS